MTKSATPDPTRTGPWLGWKVLALLSGRYRVVAALALLVCATAALDVAVPFVTRSIIDGVIHSLQTASWNSLRFLLTASIAIFAATALTRILRSIYNYNLFRLISQAEDQVKNAAFENFLSLDTEFQGRTNTGEVIAALDRGGTAVFVALYEVFGQNLLPPMFVLLGVLIALLTKSVWITVLVFLPLPAYAIAIGRLSGRMHRLEYLISHAFERVTKESFDIASNVRVVKKFAREKHEAKTHRSLMVLARTRHYQGEKLWALIENVQSLFSTAGRVGVISFGGFMVLNHRCTVGDYVLFIALQDMIYVPISQLSIILPKLRRNLTRAERMFEILEQGCDVADSPKAKLMTGPAKSVQFCNLSFKYSGAENWTLRDVSFEVPAGATVALIGPSGSGKSTLVNLLQRLYDPQQGSILIDGEDIRHVTQASLREQIAVVPQEVELFARTISENIGYGQDHVHRAQVERAAMMAQAHDFICRCDSGYDTAVGERGMRLSGGERQRLGIARAILRDPRILILDEATSHLDNESERLIQLAMEEITEGRTCFIIAHRLSTVRNADLVVVFDNNTVEAVGTHDQLWKSSATYRRLHGVTEMPTREHRLAS